jgi:hypothetical protein
MLSGKRTGRPAPRLSDILADLAASDTESITLADIVATVGERSIGALLVLLAMPNVVASAVPGMTTVFGLPVIFLSLHLLVAADRPWLPARLARTRIRRADLQRAIAFASPHLRRLERAMKPRLLILTAPWAQRLIGLTCVLLSILIFLPIPLSNLLPSIGVMLFGIALLERDGLAAIAAAAIAGISLALFGGVAVALARATAYALST